MGWILFEEEWLILTNFFNDVGMKRRITRKRRRSWRALPGHVKLKSCQMGWGDRYWRKELIDMKEVAELLW